MTPTFNMFDFTFPIAPGNLVYLSRELQPVVSYGHITKPFPSAVWLALVITIFVLATMQFVSYRVYQMPKIVSHSLAKSEEFPLNFFLYSYVKLTEPDPLPWFKKWSTGKFLTFLWTILGLFAILFYTSNLRAHFMTIEYEEPPSTLNHVAERGKRVYIFDTAVGLRSVSAPVPVTYRHNLKTCYTYILGKSFWKQQARLGHQSTRLPSWRRRLGESLVSLTQEEDYLHKLLM